MRDLMDKLDFAMQVLVIGFFVVMFTLFVLYGILVLFSSFFHKKSAKPPARDLTDRKSTAEKTDKIFDQRTAAAIIAAVYRYMQENNVVSSAGLLTISAQPSDNFKGNSWRITGRKNILENRNEIVNIRRKKRREKI
jgi:Na+-transporting methylmalonyl-CoA/oxaloacetate decarboxylase gamma subunit